VTLHAVVGPVRFRIFSPRGEQHENTHYHDDDYFHRSPSLRAIKQLAFAFPAEFFE